MTSWDALPTKYIPQGYLDTETRTFYSTGTGFQGPALGAVTDDGGGCACTQQRRHTFPRATLRLGYSGWALVGAGVLGLVVGNLIK